MIAAGLLFKEVKSETYEDNFSGLKQIENLRKKIKVQENKEFTDSYYDLSKRHIANTIYFQYTDGSFSNKETVETPIGHPNRREEAEPLLKQKFINNMSSHFSEDKAKDIWDKILLIDVDSEFKEIIKLLSND
jgi:2-methylcitrate dehydratase